jgi:putative hemolysin
MRPREDVLYYDIHEPMSKLTHLFVDLECTRIPTCDGDIEKVLGIITAKDFFLLREKLTSQEELKKYITKPFYIPETTPAKILLRRFDEQGDVIALVVNEYGSITGLITREDLLEVVIGKISDLRDQKSLYTKEGENEIIASGKLELEEFNYIFNTYLVSENNFVTISGWLTEQLGEIPKPGFKIELEGFLFHILAADPNRIRRLYIRKLKPKEKPIPK